jgi:gluconolactonase
VSPAGDWQQMAEYDGWPNGLKIDAEGGIFIADYRLGILRLDPDSGTLTSVLGDRNSEGFKGCNDLHFARDGTMYFTDQGQTGLHDPTGRVYRRAVDGKLDCLISNGISPNGLTLDASGKVLFVAMTRDNSVWRVPLQRDGGVSKVGRFCQYFGVSGPDGLAIDAQGRLYVAHASLGSVFVHARNGECIARVVSPRGTTCTNVALNHNHTRIYVTESATGTVLVADLDGV